MFLCYIPSTLRVRAWNLDTINQCPILANMSAGYDGEDTSWDKRLSWALTRVYTPTYVTMATPMKMLRHCGQLYVISNTCLYPDLRVRVGVSAIVDPEEKKTHWQYICRNTPVSLHLTNTTNVCAGSSAFWSCCRLLWSIVWGKRTRSVILESPSIYSLHVVTQSKPRSCDRDGIEPAWKTT
jgi:hypothetical protein